MVKVSVCIPTYNTARYLADAIESVLAQDFSDYELVICDNASTDETPEICRRYNDSRVRYVRFDELVNQGGNWNRCLELSSGEYVALLHADDLYLPGFLEERVRILDQQPDVGLVFGAVQLINDHGVVTGKEAFGDEVFMAPAPEFYKELLIKCVILPPSVVVRRGCYEALGRFDEKRLFAIDWEMWLRLSARFGVAYSPAVNSAYRYHDMSGTTLGIAAGRNGPDDFEVLQNALRGIEERPELAHFMPLRERALRSFAIRTLSAAGFSCEQGNLSGVKPNLQFAVRALPSLLSRPTVWVLWLSCYLGPWLYRAFRKIRPV